MPALPPPVTRTIRHNVGWDEFERLVADNAAGPLSYAYFDGTLEATPPSLTHESGVEFFRDFVATVSEESDIEIRAIGSTTIKRTHLRKGVEPDAAYYVRNEPLVRGKSDIDFAVDPPPDLVVEVDVTNDSMDKLPLFAALGFPEVWWYKSGRIQVLVLAGDGYQPQASVAFPGVDAATLNRFLTDSRRTTRLGLIRAIRQWVRSR